MVHAPSIGDVVAEKYRIEALIGEGGWGAVFRAQHTLMDRPVALKLLNSRLAARPEPRQRFFDEARSAAKIEHENVVEVYDVGVHDGAVFLVMELLEGQTLERVLQGGQLSMSRVLRLVIGAMRGAAAAHALTIVHRDIKPDNIFIAKHPDHPEGLAKILDFGVAKIAPPGDAQPLTRTGSLIGTPLYMSLEQHTDSRNVDKRADIYAFGVILYRILTGRFPYEAEEAGQLVIKLLTTRARAPRELNPNIPPALDAIVMKAIESNKDARYAALGPLIDELEACLPTLDTLAQQAGRDAAALGTQPTVDPLGVTVPGLRRRRRSVLGLASGVALAALVGAAWFALRASDAPTAGRATATRTASAQQPLSAVVPKPPAPEVPIPEAPEAPAHPAPDVAPPAATGEASSSSAGSKPRAGNGPRRSTRPPQVKARELPPAEVRVSDSQPKAADTAETPPVVQKDSRPQSPNASRFSSKLRLDEL